jgi:enamine deaminase RidA (YjgF/YER057c/UK114 family)
VTPPRGGYSHGVVVDPGARWLFISGQIPERPDGTVPADFREQCEAAWDNIETILAAAGMSVANLVKVTTFLTDPDQTLVNREIRQQRVGDAGPAVTAVVVRTLQSDWLLEIEAIAAADA